MNALLQCISHSPLMGQHDPAAPVLLGVKTAITEAQQHIQAFDPEIIILIAPDHYNGFFYDVMPAFCIGTNAYAIGDYGTAQGALNVPTDLAQSAAQYVLDSGVDIAVSHKMRVDHGFAQPLDLLMGSLNTVPVIPVFINSVATPLPSFERARCLGEALGRWARTLNQRVLIIGSGGLSHQPPVPEIASANDQVKDILMGRGRNLTDEERALKTKRVIEAARQFVNDPNTLRPLNTEWDHEFINLIAKADLARLDHISNQEVSEQAGRSAHEVKTWVAAAAAAKTFGAYQEKSRFYCAIPEWIAGFGIFTATSATTPTSN